MVKLSKQRLEQKIPVTFTGNAYSGWINGVKDWHISNATPGLYTLDIEHIADDLVKIHNDPHNAGNIQSLYRGKICVHNCRFCFNEEKRVYGKEQRDLDGNIITDDSGKLMINRIMTLEDTMNVVDQAMAIAEKEGHRFKSVKFLGPGELLMNPKLFQIIGEYQKRGIQLNIFTKMALLGSDELANKYPGMTARGLVDMLAGYPNVGLLGSFQSFNAELQDSLVTSKDKKGVSRGLSGYTEIRDKALENIFASGFYKNGLTNRVCIVNAPITPENVDESLELYRFFVERGTPVVMTPSMLSGKGCWQYKRQKQIITAEEWNSKLVELYAKVYAYNVRKGIQTHEQIMREGIASYVGGEPCNQVATGLYIRANGIAQMCPGRFDRETVFANVQDVPLNHIWENSPNRRMGIKNPHNLINNRCPAKDGFAFPNGFYERVMQRYIELAQ